MSKRAQIAALTDCIKLAEETWGKSELTETARQALAALDAQETDYEAEWGPDGRLGNDERYAAEAPAEMESLLNAQPREAEGWRLMPKRATEEMLRAAIGWREVDPAEGMQSAEADMFDRAYHAMLAAAPPPPAEKEPPT